MSNHDFAGAYCPTDARLEHFHVVVTPDTNGLLYIEVHSFTTGRVLFEDGWFSTEEEAIEAAVSGLPADMPGMPHRDVRGRFVNPSHAVN